jgi:serine/threonine-protein kinase HipA
MSALDVYLNSERVGRLEESSDGLLRFTYASEWLVRDDAVPLSRILPLSVDAYENKYARPFFAGILPEEAPRAAIARVLGISEGNDFAMLERIGGECAGAVSLLPEGHPPMQAENRVRVLDEEELVSIIHELPRRPLMAGEEGVRLSLAGAQDKLPVIIGGDTIALPLGNTPSTHIIKPEPARFEGLVTNEVFCMDLAERVGLKVAAAKRICVGDTPCIVVTRYDRKSGPEGQVIRLHQEDFCQALGRPPERKYQQEGGPTAKECIGLLREWSTVPVLDIPAFLDALCFNLLIGNADAHGKNYSLIYADGRRSMAPLYDLVSTIMWPDLSTRLAMNIGHGKAVNDLNPANFKLLAEEADLGWPMVRERIADLAGKMLHSASEKGRSLPLADTVSNRCERMLKQLE